MKLNEIRDNRRLFQAAHPRRPRHRLGQGQAVGPRRQGSDRALGRAHQGIRGRPDAAASPPAEARLHSAGAGRSQRGQSRPRSRARSTRASSNAAEPITLEACSRPASLRTRARRREDSGQRRAQGQGAFRGHGCVEERGGGDRKGGGTREDPARGSSGGVRLSRRRSLPDAWRRQHPYGRALPPRRRDFAAETTFQSIGACANRRGAARRA